MSKNEVMAVFEKYSSVSKICAYLAKNLKQIEKEGRDLTATFALFKDFTTAEEVVKYVDHSCAV